MWHAWSSFLLVVCLISRAQTQTSIACGLDIVMALDGSASLSYLDWLTLQDVVASALQALDIGPQQVNLGFVVFSTGLGYVSPQLSADKAQLVNLVKAGLDKPDTGTFTHLAILEATRLLSTSRPTAPDVIIIITDGATETKQETIASVAAASRAGITTYAIGLGRDVSPADLALLADPSRVVSVVDVNGLLVILNSITSRACSEVTTTTRTTPTTTTTTTPTPTTPPPAPVIRTPVCAGLAPTNIWLANDMSTGAESLATRSSPFDLVREAFTAFLAEPSLTAAASVVKLGVVNFNSGGGRVTRTLTPYSQARATFNNIVPDLALVSGTYLTASGLQALRPFSPANGTDDWVVVVTAVDSTTAANTDRAAAEASSLVAAGYRIYVIGVTGPDGTLAGDELVKVSTSGGLARIATFRQLTDALADFVQTRLCPVKDDLCATAKKRSANDTTGFVYHTSDCDKFIQCHFYPGRTVAVYRSCPPGQYWSQAALRCDQACHLDCPYEKCHSAGVVSHKMEGSCRAYWRCANFRSVPACCPQQQRYLPGQGCVHDPDCRDFCGHSNNLDGAGVCQTDRTKKAAVMFSRAPSPPPSDASSRLWHLKAWFQHQHRRVSLLPDDPDLCPDAHPSSLCVGATFDLVTCQCAPRNLTSTADICRPSTRVTFSGTPTPTSAHYYLRGVTLDPAKSYATFPGHLGSLLHLAVEGRGQRPLALALRYRENESVEEEVTLVRNTRCDGQGTLHVALTPGSVKVKISSPDGKFASTAVSTLGFSATEWKNLTVVYDGTSLTVSLEKEDLHYVARVDAPKIRCFTCGVNVGPGNSSESFTGDLQSAEVFYCYPPSVDASPQAAKVP